MKITIINPQEHLIFNRFNNDKKYNVHGYFIEFIKKYKPDIFLSKKRYLPLLKKFFIDINEKIESYNIIIPSFFQRNLLSNTDILLYFNGGVYANPSLFKNFNGLKLYHIMDPQYRAYSLNKFLERTGVDFLFGYNSYDKHSNFVRKLYPSFQDKIIGIPFGYSSVWQSVLPFRNRMNKAILTGTMETFTNVRKDKYYKHVNDYYNYFSSQFSSMHEIRFLIDKVKNGFSGIVDSKINHWPLKDNYIEDVIGEFNKYKFFINDESLLNFCPIRTFEGIASGSVMIANDTSCYNEWGFEDSINCIKFKSIEEIPCKIDYYSNNPELLYSIHKNGVGYVNENFNHKKIAEILFEKIKLLYTKR